MALPDTQTHAQRHFRLAAAHAISARTGKSPADVHSDMAEQHSKVIAAAPELADALRELLANQVCPLGQSKMDRWSQACDKARAALEKAGGL